jgi:hypothetical protein
VQCFTHPSLQPPPIEYETPAQRREKIKQAKSAANQERLEEQLALCTI